MRKGGTSNAVTARFKFCYPLPYARALAADRKMKTYLLLFFLFTGLVGSAFAQANTGPGDTSKTFYKWYLHELNAQHNPEQNKAKMRTFISARLVRWVNSKAYSDYGADYFIDAQDFGESWENNIQVSKLVVTGNVATLRVTLLDGKNGPMGSKILDLKLLKEAGAWKIDRITGKH